MARKPRKKINTSAFTRAYNEAIGVPIPKRRQADKNYTHFALSDKYEIMNGWDYSDVEQEELNQEKDAYFHNDMVDIYPDIKKGDYRIMKAPAILKRSVNPYDLANWVKYKDNFAKGGKVESREEKIESILNRIEATRVQLDGYSYAKKSKDGKYEIMTYPKNRDETDPQKGIRIKEYTDYTKFKNSVVRRLNSETGKIDQKFAKGGKVKDAKKSEAIWGVEVRKTEDSPFEQYSENGNYTWVKKEAERIASKLKKEGNYIYVEVDIPLEFAKGGEVKKNLTKEEQIEKFGYYKSKLLGVGDTKTAKGEKLGYRTYISYLAPFNQNSKGINLCPHASQGCASACLFSAGRGKFSSVEAGRVNKTEFFLKDRQKFMEQIDREIINAVKKEEKQGKFNPVVRLNGTTDIRFEKFKVRDGKNIMELHPDVQFYDYTKNHIRLDAEMPKNYDLTFSRSEDNHDKAMEALAKGHRVAIVFDQVPDTYNGYKVINGDESDLRFLDEKGVVVGLKVKQTETKASGKQDDIFKSGFAVRTNGEKNFVDTTDYNKLNEELCDVDEVSQKEIEKKFCNGGIVEDGDLEYYCCGGQVNAQEGGVIKGASHEDGGVPFTVNGQEGFEAEGGEVIINKNSSKMFKDELSAINVAGGGKAFADGGVIGEEQFLWDDNGKKYIVHSIEGDTYYLDSYHRKKIPFTKEDVMELNLTRPTKQNLSKEDKAFNMIVDFGIEQLDKLGSGGSMRDLLMDTYGRGKIVVGGYPAEQFVSKVGKQKAIDTVEEFEKNEFGMRATDPRKSGKLANQYAFIVGAKILENSKTVVDNINRDVTDEMIQQIKKDVASQRK